ncbi:hypothetical protein AB0J63_46905 [Streptosporangium canum]|uniref:hypothetical protein n=1 Tax=Streptosporangium canum TaxID=324952 RepID=UPI00341F4190
MKAVEISGPQGGPVEVGHNTAVIEGIIARIQQAKARREHQRRTEDASTGAPR